MTPGRRSRRRQPVRRLARLQPRPPQRAGPGLGRAGPAVRHRVRPEHLGRGQPHRGRAATTAGRPSRARAATRASATRSSSWTHRRGLTERRGHRTAATSFAAALRGPRLWPVPLTADRRRGHAGGPAAGPVRPAAHGRRGARRLPCGSPPATATAAAPRPPPTTASSPSRSARTRPRAPVSPPPTRRTSPGGGPRPCSSSSPGPSAATTSSAADRPPRRCGRRRRACGTGSRAASGSAPLVDADPVDVEGGGEPGVCDAVAPGPPAADGEVQQDVGGGGLLAAVVDPAVVLARGPVPVHEEAHAAGRPLGRHLDPAGPQRPSGSK